jgi:E3 ubiquitin-protein ligase XIAP
MTDFCIERFIISQNIPMSPIRLTIDETDEVDHNDNYRFESIRLQSYKNWPCLWMKPERLAAAGFYYTGESDKVKCFECQIEICQWQSDDNPMVDHQRWSDRCRFVRNFSCGNVPIGTDPNLIPAPSPKGKDVCGPYSMVYKPLSGPDNDLDIEETIKYNLQNLGSAKPKHPEYASYDARLHTFDNWPIPLVQNKQELASAGLYYTGSEDQTLCYHCGGGLKNWETCDDAWEQHARWFDNCPYVLMVKGREFISKATGRTYYETVNICSN